MTTACGLRRGSSVQRAHNDQPNAARGGGAAENVRAQMPGPGRPRAISARDAQCVGARTSAPHRGVAADLALAEAPVRTSANGTKSPALSLAFLLDELLGA